MKLALAALALSLALPSLAACTPTALGQQGTEARLVPLTIMSGSRRHEFRVEVARTEAEQERGLMYRTSLRPDRGMLFPMAPPRFASFWMKNTLIPLDLLFVRIDGTIASILTGEPRNLTPLVSSEPVAAVLEIPGGRAADLGIKAGDRISSPALR